MDESNPVTVKLAIKVESSYSDLEGNHKNIVPIKADVQMTDIHHKPILLHEVQEILNHDLSDFRL